MNDTARYIIECAINVQAAQRGQSRKSHRYIHQAGMLDAYAGVMDAGLGLIHRTTFGHLVREACGLLAEYYERPTLDAAIAQVVAGIEAEQSAKAERDARTAKLPVFPVSS